MRPFTLPINYVDTQLKPRLIMDGTQCDLTLSFTARGRNYYDVSFTSASTRNSMGHLEGFIPS